MPTPTPPIQPATPPAAPPSPAPATTRAPVPTAARKSQWQLSSSQGTIKGFADRVSAADKEQVRLFVTTRAPRFDVEVYRFGWYAGGAQQAEMVHRQEGASGVDQPPPTFDKVTGLISCANWRANCELIVNGWQTGLYLLKLIASDGDQNYIPLVVRDDGHDHDFLFVHAAATDQAYNNWGGKSTYSFNSTTERLPGSGGRRAVKVSFDRPYSDDGSGGNILTWGLNMVRFLEANHFDVAFVADPDVHADAQFDRRSRAILMAGHSEYWSKEMRQHLEAARNRSKGIGLFTGDTAGFAVRYESSPLGDNRVLVSYKESTANDPEAAVDPSRATTLWANPPLDNPMQRFIGVGTGGPVVRSADWTVVGASAAPRLFRNTGFNDGDVVQNLVGYEYDGLWTPGFSSTSPPGLKVLGRARVSVPTPVKLASGFVARQTFADAEQPVAGQLAAEIDPGSDWANGSLDVGFATPTGVVELRYAPGGDADSKLPYTRDRGFCAIFLGPNFAQPGWRPIRRDLAADYAAVAGPTPAGLRVAYVQFRGSGSLGPITLTPPEGEATTVGPGDQTPEAAGWRIVQGQGQLTAVVSGNRRALRTSAAPGERRDDEAHAVLIESDRGGAIFVAGSIQWSWSLDEAGRHKDEEGRQTPVDPRMQALTRNVLTTLLNQPA